MREEKAKQEKFNYEKMKRAATDADPAVRKRVFIEYFERFEEFPSYLYDNETKMDERLFETMQDILTDPATPKSMLKGAQALMRRIPS